MLNSYNKNNDPYYNWNYNKNNSVNNTCNWKKAHFFKRNEYFRIFIGKDYKIQQSQYTHRMTVCIWLILDYVASTIPSQWNC